MNRRAIDRGRPAWLLDACPDEAERRYRPLLGHPLNRRTTRLGRRAMAFGRRQAGTNPMRDALRCYPSPRRRPRVLFSATHGVRGLWVGAGEALHWGTRWGNQQGCRIEHSTRVGPCVVGVRNRAPEPLRGAA